MTYISTIRKWFILTLVVLSFATSLLPHSFAAPLYAKSIVKGASHSPTSYPQITPTWSTSSDSGDDQPQHHSSGSTSTNNQHHERGTGGADGRDDNEYNNAIVEINTQ